MVEASKKVAPILVDCSARGAQSKLMGQFGVQGFPTMLFLDRTGAVVAELESRDADSLISRISQISAVASPGLPILPLVAGLAIVGAIGAGAYFLAQKKGWLSDES